jgi:Domain of unknown function (DUF1844)
LQKFFSARILEIFEGLDMADKKESFTVTDRRMFTSEGELRKDVTEETSKPAAEAPPSVKTAVGGIDLGKTPEDKPSGEDNASGAPAPTASEQQAQAEAYRKSSKDLDTRVELSGHSARELEMTFERFLASLYMSAMLQLGLMREEGGQPRVDLIGARQTIDTIGLLAEKTKGNLTTAEENFLQHSLYELRMAYVEVTNALARPPQATGTEGDSKGR